jgi:hypothetical protein
MTEQDRHIEIHLLRLCESVDTAVNALSDPASSFLAGSDIQRQAAHVLASAIVLRDTLRAHLSARRKLGV